MRIVVSKLIPEDREQWQGLYRDYADFYAMPMTKKILNTIWSWIHDDTKPFFCLVAKNEAGDVVGFAHCREMPSPLRGALVGFLDDLYVKPEYRGTGCVQCLYEELKNLGKQRRWSFIRWITAENNHTARSSYAKVAQKTHWLTYQMAVE